MRRLFLAGAVLTLLLAANALAQESPQASRPAVPRTGELKLVNPTGVDLTVEIRLATATGCDGTIIGRPRVKSGAATVVATSQRICIRRESVGPGGSIVRGGWEAKELTRGSVVEVVL